MGSLFKGIFGGSKSSTSAPPPVKPVTPMPEPDDDAARRARLVSLQARRGRQSTYLTSGTGRETLG
jgi:hypothetical protein